MIAKLTRSKYSKQRFLTDFSQIDILKTPFCIKVTFAFFLTIFWLEQRPSPIYKHLHQHLPRTFSNLGQSIAFQALSRPPYILLPWELELTTNTIPLVDRMKHCLLLAHSSPACILLPCVPTV